MRAPTPAGCVSRFSALEPRIPRRPCPFAARLACTRTEYGVSVQYCSRRSGIWLFCLVRALSDTHTRESSTVLRQRRTIRENSRLCRRECSFPRDAARGWGELANGVAPQSQPAARTSPQESTARSSQRPARSQRKDGQPSSPRLASPRGPALSLVLTRRRGEPNRGENPVVGRTGAGSPSPSAAGCARHHQQPGLPTPYPFRDGAATPANVSKAARADRRAAEESAIQ